MEFELIAPLFLYPIFLFWLYRQLRRYSEQLEGGFDEIRRLKLLVNYYEATMNLLADRHFREVRKTQRLEEQLDLQKKARRQ
jgi:hypothetical protein